MVKLKMPLTVCFVLLVGMVLSGCPMPAVVPMADFSATPTSGNAPLAVQFTDASDPGSESITDWAWDFGDGNTSTEMSPTHTYSAAGTYTVSLTVTTSVGADTESKADFIVAAAPKVGPTAGFVAETRSGEAPFEVAFESRSLAGDAPITSYLWNFGDGFTSDEENPTHTYGLPGTYNVTLTVGTEVGMDAELKADYAVINAPGNAVVSEKTRLLDYAPGVEVNAVTDGGMTLTYTGEGEVPVAEGDILVGTAHGGYLRKVVGVTGEGSELTVITEEASLVDAVDTGSLATTIEFASDELSKANVFFYGTGTGYIDFQDGLTLSDGGVALEVKGAVFLQPAVDLDISVEGGDVEHFQLTANNRLYGVDFDYTISGEATRFHAARASLFDMLDSPKPVTVSTPTIGGVPVLVTTEFDLVIGFEHSSDAPMRAGSGFDFLTEMSFGAEFDGTNWKDKSIVGFNRNYHGFHSNIVSSLEQRVYLEPRVSVRIFDAPGPYCAARSFVRTSADPNTQPVRGNIHIGIQTEQGFGADQMKVVSTEIDSELEGETFQAEILVDTFTSNPDTPNDGEPNVGDGNENGGEDLTIMLPGQVPLELIWVEPGSFLMGRNHLESDSFAIESPKHEVELPGGFWLGKYEITQAQWVAVMDTTPWAGHPLVIEDPNAPAVHISWYDAQAFITALTNLTDLPFRLPSEAEWEYAARAGTDTRFHWGDDPLYFALYAHGWWQGNSGAMNEKYAHPVGMKLPNPWGFYDMNGNVWEWCQDWFEADYYQNSPVVSPFGPEFGVNKVMRGGSWGSSGGAVRTAVRGDGHPGTKGSYFGFRVAR